MDEELAEQEPRKRPTLDGDVESAPGDGVQGRTQ